jgi:hypothetical protein
MRFGPDIMPLFRQGENSDYAGMVQERFFPEFGRNVAFYLNRYRRPSNLWVRLFKGE